MKYLLTALALVLTTSLASAQCSGGSCSVGSGVGGRVAAVFAASGAMMGSRRVLSFDHQPGLFQRVSEARAERRSHRRCR